MLGERFLLLQHGITTIGLIKSDSVINMWQTGVLSTTCDLPANNLQNADYVHRHFVIMYFSWFCIASSRQFCEFFIVVTVKMCFHH